MNIQFDALPLISDKITGVGWCEAGQTTSMARLHPENTYSYNFFSRKDDNVKLQRLAPFSENIKPNIAHFSGYAYRAVSNFIPVPYSMFFGKDADITHFFNYIAPPSVHGRTVITVHDMAFRAFPETVRGRTKIMLNTGLRQSMERADVIVTVSRFSRNEIIKYYPEYRKKIRIVPCGVDLNKFRPCGNTGLIRRVKKILGINGEYFLYLGTIEPRKNLERLINAYYIFAKRTKNPPKLVLAGGKGWLYDSIFQRVKDLNLSEKVIFTQYIPSEYINPLMCGAIAFVFPSIYEGFGIPPLEAMACGVPVLSSDSASLPEVTGNCAVMCDAYSSESIADGLQKLYSDENLRAELHEKGLARAKKFTWDKSAEALYKIYKEII